MKQFLSKLFIFTFILSHSVGSQASYHELKNSTQSDTEITKPSRTEIISPIKKETFNNEGACAARKQGGNPRETNGYLVFDGATDGNRQVDPQIAVGGGYVLHATNKGLIIYEKKGNVLEGVSPSCFNKGIDPKLFFDPHNKVFGFDLWNPWDKKKKKPVNISISETNDPRGAWNTYPVPVPGGVDGGGIGYSRKWIGYSFPGGKEQSFVMRMAEVKNGKPATVYHFQGSLGHPVMTQDPVDDLLFFKITNKDIIIKRVYENENGIPVCETVCKKPHHLEFVNYPPKSPQKNTDQLTASGDRNPKVTVVQNGFIWFSQTINYKGRAAVQWHQIKMDGSIVQTGLISSHTSSYIQTTLAVNKNNDVLIGFQETSPDMFISPRMTFRLADDPPGQVREIISLGEGEGATSGTSWGDYSGSTIDGDNLLDLWTIQSITNKEGKGHTVIAKIPLHKE